MTTQLEDDARSFFEARRMGDDARLRAAVESLRDALSSGLRRRGLASWLLDDWVVESLRNLPIPSEDWPSLRGSVYAVIRRHFLACLHAALNDPKRLSVLQAPSESFIGHRAEARRRAEELGLGELSELDDQRLRDLSDRGEEATEVVVMALFATQTFFELHPFFERDLRIALDGRRRLLERTRFAREDIEQRALARLRDRGVDHRERTHHPYLVMYKWLKTTAIRRALDGLSKPAEAALDLLEERGVLVDPGDSPEEVLAGRGQRALDEWVLSQLPLRLPRRLAEACEVLLHEPPLSSVECALRLGYVTPETVASAATAATARKEVERAANRVDQQRRRVRTVAQELRREAEARSRGENTWPTLS